MKSARLTLRRLLEHKRLIIVVSHGAALEHLLVFFLLGLALASVSSAVEGAFSQAAGRLGPTTTYSAFLRPRFFG
jgi:hypothetical protein